ncbi:hypothetical protein [Microvirga arabica]|uniref:hypothetical protein n=1 Tax=Microvirga arabica TaxID=1128671 RepID=UPI00193A4588|nr:hypothetical protein [Microvirga arabica]MBM1172003.1 hypothetical protein [Microvirga arabica]
MRGPKSPLQRKLSSRSEFLILTLRHRIHPAPRVGAAVPWADTRVTVASPGCDVQSYIVGSGERVRVRQC